MRASTMIAFDPRCARLALALLALTACGDDGGEADIPDGAGEGPLYVVATSFTSADQTETYFVTTKDLDGDAEIDPTDGPRVLGGVVPVVHEGMLFVPEANRIIRYDVGADDKLEKADEFRINGVTELFSWHIWIVSSTKAYVFDPAGLRIIVWDPTAMKVTGKEIDLQDIDRAGWTPNLVFEHSGPSARGDQLLVPLGWTDQDGNARYASGMVVLDKVKDEVVAVAEDERCGASYATVEAPNGDVYFFPPSWSSAPHYFYDEHGPTCVLHVSPGSNTFAKAAPLDLSALGTGSAAAGAMPDGETGFFFTSADEQLWDDGNNEGGAFWQVWHYDFETERSEPVADLPAWAGELYYVDVGERYLVPYWEETSTGQRTLLYDLQVGAAPKKMLSFEASWYGVAKLR